MLNVVTVIPQYIAKRLFEIKEKSDYTDPSTLTPDKRAAQDEELFQIARLVNCGWFGMGDEYFPYLGFDILTRSIQLYFRTISPASWVLFVKETVGV